MDWQIPRLKFNHIQKVKDKAGVNLASLEDVADLYDELTLKPVLDILSEVGQQEIDHAYYGQNIEDAQNQIIDRLKDFFPPQKALLLSSMVSKIREHFKTLEDSGNTGSSLQDM